MTIKKKHKRGFTLIEMLIVIVIIGILAAALIPRLLNARGRANDVARKADLQQIATVLVAYQIDNGKFPTGSNRMALSAISTGLISAGMNGIPTDPNTSRVVNGLPAGQFGYITIHKGGIPDNGFVLMAATETAGGSNYVSAPPITSSTEETSDIHLCTTFIQDPGGTVDNDENGTCTYDPAQDQLRYIFMY